MVSFSFLHAADIHLDSPLRGLSRYPGLPVETIRRATREALDRLVATAIERAVAFVVLAGDLYDGDWQDAGTGLHMAQALGRLHAAGIAVYLVRGNHDAASIVMRDLPLPPGVHRFSDTHAQTATIDDLRVAIHGRGFASRHVPDDMTATYPAPVAGHFNIGILHTSLTGYEGHAAYAPTTPERLRALGYDYWALGHVHERQVVATSPPIVFPGVLQGRNIRETGAKGAMLVHVVDNVPTLEPITCDVVRWARISIDCEGLETQDELQAALRQGLEAARATADGRVLIARLALTGATTLHGALSARQDALRDAAREVAALLGGEIGIEKITLDTHFPTTRDRRESLALDPALLEDPALLAEIAADLGAFLRIVPHGVDAQDADSPLARAQAGNWAALLASAADALSSRLDEALMRFRQLDLIRYGGFADHTLAFPDQGCDLHVVIGHNEAGKSTTMAAIADFLFGFMHKTAQDWRHDADKLRIGATLERGGAHWAAIRRKGRKQTLGGPDDTPLDAGPLDAWLGGLDRDAFLRGWSLDHARLREGGQAMLGLKDDLGQQLLAASSGLTSLRQVREAIDAETREIYRPTRAITRFSQAREMLMSAQADLRASIVTPRAWVEAGTALAACEAELAALHRQSGALAADRARLERIHRLAGPITALDAVEDATDFATRPVLSRADCDTIARTRTDIDAARRLHDDAALELANLHTRLAALTPDDAILQAAEALAALAEQRNAMRTLRDRLPAIAAEAARTRTLRDAAFARADRDAGGTLPDAAARTLLRRRAPDLHGAWATYAAARANMDAAARRIDTTENTPDGAAPVAAHTPETLRAAQHHARKASHADAELAARRTAQAEAANRARDLLAGLHPRGTWQIAALRGLSVPDAAEISRQARTLGALSDAARMAAREREQAEAALARRSLECTQIARDAAIVTEQDLAAARHARDATLDDVTASLAESRLPTTAAMTALREAVTTADTLADRRFEQASDVGRLVIARQAEEQARLVCTQASVAAERRTTEEHAGITAWQKPLTAAGLPDLSPALLATWLGQRDAILSADARCAELDTEIAHLDGARVAAIAWLVPFHAGPPGDGSLTAWIDATDDLIARADGAQTQEMRRQEQKRAATRQLHDTQVAEKNARELVEAAATAWRDAVKRTDSAPDDALYHPAADAQRAAWLDLLDAADAAHAACVQATDASTAQHARLAAFEQQVASAWRALEGEPAPPCDDALAQLLARAERARDIARVEAGLQERMDEARLRNTSAEAALRTAASLRAPLAARAQTDDQTGLDAAAAQAQAWRAQDERCKALSAAILGQGDGLALADLRAEQRAIAPDSLAAAKQEAIDAEAGLRVALADAARRSGEARSARDSLRLRAEGETTGLLAADRIETARADLATCANDYLLLRAQGLILRHAVERHRNEAQSPMLTRASRLFARATCERYAGLHVRDDSDPPTLAAMRPDEVMVPIDALSEGTRDQLFLCLRVAALEQALDRGARLPFLADDLFINFDDMRADAGLGILSDLARRTQVIFFTHHPHLAARAPEGAHIHQLA